MINTTDSYPFQTPPFTLTTSEVEVVRKKSAIITSSPNQSINTPSEFMADSILGIHYGSFTKEPDIPQQWNPPSVKHNLDEVLDLIPSSLQLSRTVSMMRQSVSIANISPVYMHFLGSYMADFRKSLLDGVDSIDKLLKLRTVYVVRVSKDMGIGHCLNDPWCRLFF